MFFEQAYGDWLVSELNLRIQEQNANLVCRRYDDVAFKPLYHDPDGIAVILNGGNATRSPVHGQDRNILPLAVTVVCKEQYSTLVRTAIDVLQRDYNAVPHSLLCDDAKIGRPIRISLKSLFSTPYVLEESDYPTMRETIKAAFLNFSVTVFYGEHALLAPQAVSLKIDEHEYQLEHVSAFAASAVPAYEAYVADGEERQEQIPLSRGNSYHFTLYKTDTDGIQEVFNAELYGEAGGLVGHALTLVIGEKEIAVRTYQLTEQYVDNAFAYDLVLGV